MACFFRPEPSELNSSKPSKTMALGLRGSTPCGDLQASGSYLERKQDQFLPWNRGRRPGPRKERIFLDYAAARPEGPKRGAVVKIPWQGGLSECHELPHHRAVRLHMSWKSWRGGWGVLSRSLVCYNVIPRGQPTCCSAVLKNMGLTKGLVQTTSAVGPAKEQDSHHRTFVTCGEGGLRWIVPCGDTVAQG